MASPVVSMSLSSYRNSKANTNTSIMNSMARSVDLVISFTATKKTTLSSSQTRKEAARAKLQYPRLLETLRYSKLKAVGRRGESLGHLLVFISCPKDLLDSLVRRERNSDFLSGLPVTPIPEGVTIGPLSPADRIRLIHSYVTSMPIDGGLGITPDSPDWDCVESVFPLHDKEFDEAWIHSWQPKQPLHVAVGKIRDELGDSVAYYYAFLSAYTYFLFFPAVLGLIAYFFLEPYSPIYSILTCIWSIVFVEWWRVHERILSLRFHTRGSERVEKRRAQYKPGLSWWSKDLRVLASVPLILLFATILGVLLTGIFVLEAFVTALYEGPGKQILSFLPTILFAALVPHVLAIYRTLAARFTTWENHVNMSTHHYSLTIKTFALSAIVSYLALGLSAFIYVPFGEGLMERVQLWLSTETQHGRWRFFGKHLWNSTALGNPFRSAAAAAPHLATLAGPVLPESTAFPVKVELPVPARTAGVWDMDVQHARQKLDPSRLKNQMFAYLVTNQVMDTFMEVGMPYVMRAVNNAFRKNGKGKKVFGGSSYTGSTQKGERPRSPPPTATPMSPSVVSVSGASSTVGTGSPSIRKRVVFEDEQERGGLEEREFLDKVREEAALPGYDLFQDYSEMVTQFGYVAVWSTIWPLASVMALVNNFFEIRSDAFKMTVHFRRPVPTRTDTIGPWLDTLTFLTWLAALVNASLVYLFSPISKQLFAASAAGISRAHEKLFGAAAAKLQNLNEKHIGPTAGGSSTVEMELLLMRSLLIALIASHGYILVRALVRHVVEQLWWRERTEVKQREKEVMAVRERFLKGLGTSVKKGEKLSWSWSQGSGGDREEVLGTEVAKNHGQTKAGALLVGFWDHDDGLEEIERISKDS
ncbi:hypothetical protein M378DRAFT_172635 [Amanita muscaria Koide BX008]|uniref:DUF590-domain-containing protein n=1 Tax=Amanita muscaria (strain Koide BX008) TaxID=946122 RepID=A0A0C2WIQ0_AMAMK|nr:hypothetical protein M378DRAFT_172635 [Amanita muscaria Koide BX008]